MPVAQSSNSMCLQNQYHRQKLSRIERIIGQTTCVCTHCSLFAYENIGDYSPGNYKYTRALFAIFCFIVTHADLSATQPSQLLFPRFFQQNLGPKNFSILRNWNFFKKWQNFEKKILKLCLLKKVILKHF